MTLSKIGMQGAVSKCEYGLIVFALFFILSTSSLNGRRPVHFRLGGIRQAAPLLTTVFWFG